MDEWMSDWMNHSMEEWNGGGMSEWSLLREECQWNSPTRATVKRRPFCTFRGLKRGHERVSKCFIVMYMASCQPVSRQTNAANCRLRVVKDARVTSVDEGSLRDITKWGNNTSSSVVVLDPVSCLLVVATIDSQFDRNSSAIDDIFPSDDKASPFWNWFAGHVVVSLSSP